MARASVLGNNEKNKVTARIIFDDCVQRLYIKEGHRKLLSLPKIGEKHVAMKVFGVKKNDIELVDIVVVHVRSHYKPGK